MQNLLSSALALLLLAAAPAFAAQEHELSPENFDALRALVLPSAEELDWKQIPWRTSLWAGVTEAREAQKPLLLWAMNGHPLGCT